MTSLLGGLASDEPLDPSADDARDLLRRELLRPEYHEQDTFRRLVEWLQRSLDSGLDRAAGAPALSTLAAMLVFLALLATLAWLISRARRTARSPQVSGPLLGSQTRTAAELRARAEAALADGRFAEASVEAFRALARGQVERGRLDDAPGATAHEVAVALGGEHPALAGPLDRAALLFDSVRYGARPATRDQAASVLALDADLTVRR